MLESVKNFMGGTRSERIWFVIIVVFWTLILLAPTLRWHKEKSFGTREYVFPSKH